ncbi:hypothetical protein ACW95P_01230 [Candidatus Mycoplasma pogonae]
MVIEYNLDKFLWKYRLLKRLSIAIWIGTPLIIILFALYLAYFSLGSLVRANVIAMNDLEISWAGSIVFAIIAFFLLVIYFILITACGVMKVLMILKLADLVSYFKDNLEEFKNIERIRTMMVWSFFIPFGTIATIITQRKNIEQLKKVCRQTKQNPKQNSENPAN